MPGTSSLSDTQPDQTLYPPPTISPSTIYAPPTPALAPHRTPAWGVSAQYVKIKSLGAQKEDHMVVGVEAIAG